LFFHASLNLEFVCQSAHRVRLSGPARILIARQECNHEEGKKSNQARGNYYQYNEKSFAGPTDPRYFHANNAILSLRMGLLNRLACLWGSFCRPFFS
jgi:hypothetical protein